MSSEKTQPKKRVLKAKPQTVRERAVKASAEHKPRRLKQASTTAVKPLKAALKTGRKEYYLPLPDNKVGRFLNKRRKFIPSYFARSFDELKQVKWPSNKETAKLTLAVFLFALFFGTIITLADYGLDKLFKKLILN